MELNDSNSEEKPITQVYLYLIVACLLMIINIIYIKFVKKSSVNFMSFNCLLCLCCACSLFCMANSYPTMAWICAIILILFILICTGFDMFNSTYAQYIDPGMAFMNYIDPVNTNDNTNDNTQPNAQPNAEDNKQLPPYKCTNKLIGKHYYCT
jgi:glucan phosphoethanolaminetransferase (alkaline phosphatase superfamily)